MTDCIFCGIVAGDVPGDIVYSDAQVIAFRDLNPAAPTHVLVAPKRHLVDWTDLATAAPDLAAPLVAATAEVAQQLELDDYRVVANRGAGAGQTVFHLHLHLLGGRDLSWPPG